MNLVDILKQQIRAFAEGRLSAEEFEDWYVPAFWDVDPDGELARNQMVRRVESLLIDWKSGDISESELALLMASLHPERADFHVVETVASSNTSVVIHRSSGGGNVSPRIDGKDDFVTETIGSTQHPIAPS